MPVPSDKKIEERRMKGMTIGSNSGDARVSALKPDEPLPVDTGKLHPEGNFTHNNGRTRFQVIHRDNKAHMITNEADAQRDIRERRRKAVEQATSSNAGPAVVPLEGIGIKPLGATTVDLDGEIPVQIRRQLHNRFFDDPKIPEWRKKSARNRSRTDL